MTTPHDDLIALVADAIRDADYVSDRIIAGRYRANLSDTEMLRNRVRQLASALYTAISRPAEPVEAEGVGEPVAWPNGCNETIPKALRFLAKYERPASGHQDFNSEHLYQLADEIEQMASRPLYTHPPKSPGIVELLKLAYDNMFDGEAREQIRRKLFE